MTALDDEDGDPTDALSSAPAAARRWEAPGVGRVKFFHGPMDCGKSTLALQIDHNLARQGRQGLSLVRHDRSGLPRISSRIGIARRAVELGSDTDVRAVVRRAWERGRGVDYVVVDEAQFLSPAQVEQLAELADDAGVDGYCFGIATDFRGELFPGARRLVELADEVEPVQVEVLCWCGRAGRFNARVADGVVLRTGETVVVADTVPGQEVGPSDAPLSAGEVNSGPTHAPRETTTVRYQVLCRRHFRLGEVGPDASGPGQLQLT
ncbi:thymidine kinase [Saccharomonospora saliphila]|uniref:thymidine kinase n=1 Tax=Saccharomonospora saliphila TaxID=369829 RepID=UPI000379D822|nr:thymidine kinase [Saccharomonospora saliphila]